MGMYRMSSKVHQVPVTEGILLQSPLEERAV